MLIINGENYYYTGSTKWTVLGGIFLDSPGLKRLRIAAFINDACLQMCINIKSDLYSLIIT